MPIWVPVAKTLINAGIAQKLPAIRKVMKGGVEYLHYLSRRILASPNEELVTVQSDLGAVPPETIDLSIGAPTVMPGLLETLASDDPRFEVRDYPPLAGFPIFRKRIAQKYAEDQQLQVDPEREILVTNGVSQAIGLALDSFVDWGSRVVVFDPSFFLYRLAAQNRGAWVRSVRLTSDGQHDRFDEKELRNALRGSRLLFLNSPANPTGGIIDKDDLERIVYWCNRHDVLIFSDEVYEKFYYDAAPRSVACIKGAQKRTILAGGFSKSHGLSAYRVGYLSAPEPLVRPMLVTLLSQAPFVSVLGQRLGMAALDLPTQHWQTRILSYRRRREKVVQALHNAGLTFASPAGAFYAWFRVGPDFENAQVFVRSLLTQAGVRLMAGRIFGKEGLHYARLSFAGDEEKLDDGLHRLSEFLASHEPRTLSFRQASDVQRLRKAG